MIFEHYSDEFRETPCVDSEQGSTANEFVDLVHSYMYSRSFDLWKYFGILGTWDRSAREIRRMFAIWCSMLERKAGTHKFRIVAGAEIRGRSVSFHVFIGGVVPGKDFQEEWIDQWLKLGGSSAWLQKLDWPCVEAYLKGFSPDQRFEILVATEGKLRGR